MGCFSCFDSPADEQLNPKFGGAGGYGGASSAAAAYGAAGAGAGIGRHGDRGYPDLQQAPMAAPRVEKFSAGA
jgi:serine/threonine-protein kinase PBS1